MVLLPGEPRIGTDTSCTVLRARGGSAANVAVAAARAGAPAAYVGRVGADEVGDRLVGQLRSAGVEVRGERAGRTGSIVVLVAPDGERTMLTDRGDAARLGPADAAWVAGAAVLHVPAYSLADGPIRQTSLDLWRHVGRGPLRSVDASSTALLDQRGAVWWRNELAALAPDVLFADAAEAAFLGIGDAPPPGLDLVVLKDGPRPARVLRAGSDPVEVPAEGVERVLDSTGAGDAFAAGWLVATIAGADPVEATVAAHRVAREAVAVAGALS